MRRAVFVALLTAMSGCYLFSDEPKARKQEGEPSATSASASAAVEEPASSGESPTPAALEPGPATSECPEFLTGIETQARTLPSSCASVRVRGQYRVEGGSLTIEAGVELRFEAGAALEVGRDAPGVLVIAGTSERPVRMIADADAQAGGAWAGLRLHAGAEGSKLAGLELVGAGTEEHGALFIAAREVSVDGLRIQGARKLALELSAPEGGPEILDATLEGTGVLVRTTAMGAAGLLGLRLDPGASVAVDAGEIELPIEWPAHTYRIEGVIRVAGPSDADRPAQLSLAPGVELGFGPAGRVVLGGLGPGVLSASASPLPSLLGGPPTPPEAPPEPGPDPSFDERIVLRAAGDARPGAWGGVHVQAQGQLILRNVELAHGGSRDEGVIVAESGSKLSLEGCHLRENLVGVELRGTEIELETLANNEFLATPVALRSPPALIAAVASGSNRFAPGAQIQIERGRVETDANWAAAGVELVVRGDVFVDAGATLTLPPGSQLSFAPGVILGVGYYAEASLDMRGRADAPIELRALVPRGPAGPEPELSEPWGGVVLGHHASKVRFEHLLLTQTANAAAIELRDGADATLVQVDCRDCAGATVMWDCESSVGNIGVKASGTTPTAMLAPHECK